MRLPLRMPAVAVVVTATVLAIATSNAAAAQRGSCRGADAPATAANLEQAADAVLCMVNAERTARGLPPLHANSRLAKAARGHTRDMLARHYFDHVDPDGDSPGDRASILGYHWVTIAENIASAQVTPREVMTAWMASRGHCRNILAPNVSEIGVAVATGSVLGDSGATWTQEFGQQVTARVARASSRPQSGCPFGASSSTERRLVSDSSATRTVRATATRRGRRITVRGTVSPERRHVRVAVAVTVGGDRVAKGVRTDASGAFVTTITAPAGEGRIRTTVRVAGVPTLDL